MNLEIKGKLTSEEREIFAGCHNGMLITALLDRLYLDGYTSPIRVIGYKNLQTVIVNQYEAFIIEGEMYVSMSTSNLEGIANISKSMRDI